MMTKSLTASSGLVLRVWRRSWCNDSVSPRLRFAPSPTGSLHLGGLRTALYNYLAAKSRPGGVFILRIEDTDRKRLVPGAAQALEEDLSWAGIIPDESPLRGGPCQPYVQSQRTALYKDAALRLVALDHAYYCFCSESRLDTLRKNAIKNAQVPRYDNKCRRLSRKQAEERVSKGDQHCVRFKLIPSQGFNDLIYGRITHDVQDIEGDPVILKKDGLPTYHLANVVDDRAMEITHVIRGAEWLQSTEKHLMIYKALDYTPPTFGHLPLLLDSDGSKLSKRKQDLSVGAMRSKGLQPAAIVRLLLSTGGGFNPPKDISYNVNLAQLSPYFDLSSISPSPSKLPLDKLNLFNRFELVRQVNDPTTLTYLIDRLKQLVSATYPSSDLRLNDDHVKTVLQYFSSRIYFLDDLLDKNLSFLWVEPNPPCMEGGEFRLLSDLIEILERDAFNKEALSATIKQFSISNSIPLKHLMKLLRKVVCGAEEGPSMSETLELLGKTASLDRLRRAVAQNRASSAG